MKYYSNLNSNFEPYEERKEMICSQNNKKLYSNLHIDGIIHDLKKKGFNDIQIRDIIISIENNNFQGKLNNKNTPINNKYRIRNTLIGKSLNQYNLIMNETDINKRKIHSFYNIKTHIPSNINEIRNKTVNDNMNKNKSLKTTKIKNANSYISYNFNNINYRNNNLSDIIYNIECDNKRKLLSIPYDKNNKKNCINKNIYHIFEDNTKNENKLNSFNNLENTKYNNLKFSNNKKEIINNTKKGSKNDNMDKNIYIKKKSSKINISSINKNSQSSKIKKIDIKKKKYYSYINYYNAKYNSNSCQARKAHKINLRSSYLLFQGKLINPNNETINYKTDVNKFVDNCKELYYKNTSNINNKSQEKNLTNRNNDNNNNLNIKINTFFDTYTMNKNNNHSFYNSSYGNLNDNKKHETYSIQNSNKGKKVHKVYNYSFNILDKKKRFNSNIKYFGNTSKKVISYKNLINCPRNSKNIITDIDDIKKENNISNIISPKKTEQKERNRNILNNSYNKNNLIYRIINNNNNTMKIQNKYNFIIMNNRNNSEIKNNKLKIEKIADDNTNNDKKQKKSNLFYDGIRYRKLKREYHDGRYEGIIINNKREIKGVMYYKNGSKYEGQWKNDKKHGKGIYTSQNYNNPNLIGIKYEGEFNNDKIEGYGVGKYTSGDKYEGEWKNNKQYGRGTLIYKGGGKYIGEWKNGKLNGDGIYYLKNGERFEGNFIDDKYNGYGKYYYNDGEFLEGIFKNDLPTGSCILHKIDGTSEERNFD